MNWWQPSNPSDALRPSPWIHPAAACYLDSLLDESMEVIEHGCGGSTLWLASRVHFVTSIDNSAEWLAHVNKEKPMNVQLIEATNPPAFLSPCDLLLIDGNGNDRPAWIEAAPRLVKQGGIIVIDDSNRQGYQLAIAKLEKLCSPPLKIETRVLVDMEGRAKYWKQTQTMFLRLGDEWI